jgi:small subunit ribosomal protein S7
LKTDKRQPNNKKIIAMRKTKPKKRQVLPDPVYGDVRVTKFVNHLMYDGKKSLSYDIFYSALDTVKAKLANEEKSALEIWKAALDNITPQVEVKSRRVGGATFQVPTEIRPERKESVSMKNLILYARKRGGKSMADKLAAEIIDAVLMMFIRMQKKSGTDIFQRYQ